MKKLVYLFFVFSLFLLLVNVRQVQAQETKNPFPMDQLREANKELDEGLKKQDAPLVIKSLLSRAEALTSISPDSIVTVIAQIETITNKSSNVTEKAVLHSILALFYNNYYEANRWQIAQRPKQKRAENILSWDKAAFLSKIDELLQASLAPQQILAETPVSTYQIALQLGKDSPMLRPTLFDFLGHQAIATYMSIGSGETNDSKIENKQILFLPATEFIEAANKPLGENFMANIFSIYANLLSHSNPQSPAYLYCNLERLRDAFFISKQYTNTDFYANSLWALTQQYANNPFVAEVAINLCQNASSTDSAAYIKKAYLLAKKLIAQFPNYQRISCLKECCEWIESKALSTSYKETVYPMTPTKVEINYKNTQTLLVEIHTSSLNNEYTHYGTQKDAIPLNKLVFEKTISLGDTLSYVHKKMEIELPGLGMGCYAVTITPDGNKKIQTKSYLLVSRLFPFSRTYGSNDAIFVVDLKSGKPIKGATVTYLKNKNDKKVKLFFTTDKTGCATIATKESHSSSSYRVTHKGDSATQESGIYSNYYLDEKPRPVNTAIFTDRSIYRPGNTIQFSGILYDSQQKVVVNKEIIISLYSVNNILSNSATVKTDAFGSFAGSFVIPQKIVAGSYMLGCAETNNSINLTIQDFKKPTFQIETNIPTGVRPVGKIVTVTGQVESFSGIRLAGSKVEYKITKQPFYRYYRPNHNIEDVISETANCDSNGRFSISFTPNNDKKTGLFLYRLQMTVTTATGETAQKEINIPVGYVKMNMEISLPEYVNKECTDSVFKIELFDGNNLPIKRECNYVLYALQEKDSIVSDGILNLENRKIKIEATYGKMISGVNTHIPRLSVLESGAYRLVCSTTDSDGNLISKERSFILYSNKDRRLPIQIALWVPQKEFTAKEGETTSVSFGSSYKDGYLFYTLFDGNNLVAQKNIRINDRNHTVKIEYKPSYGKQLTLAVFIVRNGQLQSQEIIIKKVVPSHKLYITAETFRDKVLPNAQENWTFRVKDEFGKPVSARFMAEMYDKALDSLQPHNWEFAPRHNSANQYYRFIFNTPYWNTYASSPYNQYPSGKCDELEFDKFGISVQDRRFQPLSFKSTKIAGMRFSNNAPSNFLIRGRDSASDSREAGSDSYRSTFEETAFFYPQLTTNENGEVGFSFVVPEVNTEWQFQALAYTQTLQHGALSKSVISQKQLMVTPNIPQYLRQGDETTVSTLVSNLSDNVLQGEMVYELYNPMNDSIIGKQKAVFILQAGENKTETIKITTPSNITLLGIRVKAESPQFSDGEQHIIPVLSNRMLMTEAYNFDTNGKSREESFSMDAALTQRKGEENYRFTLEYTANPIWYAIGALSQMNETKPQSAIELSSATFGLKTIQSIGKEYPALLAQLNQYKATPNKSGLLSSLSRNEELKGILLNETPWLLSAKTENERLENLVHLFNTNENNYTLRALEKSLSELQLPDGGWCWFPGGRASTHVSLAVLSNQVKAMQLNTGDLSEMEKMGQIKTLKFLDKKIAESKSESPWLDYLYVRSYFRDIPLTGETLKKHKEWVSSLQSQWLKYSIAEKGKAAMILFRYGYKDTAQRIVVSIRQHRTCNKLEMYWQTNRNITSDDRSTAIETQCQLIDLWHEMQEPHSEIESMRIWLLKQKEAQSWGNNSVTSKAVHTLLLTQTNKQLANCNGKLMWNGKEYSFDQGEPLTGYIQTMASDKEITKNANTVSISNSCTDYTIGALYRQYFTQNHQAKNYSNGEVSLERELLVEKRNGNERQFVPLNQTQVEAGDRILVKLRVKTLRDLEFVEIKDQRAACFEPVEQLSRYIYQENVGYFKENKTTETTLFIDRLPKGNYEFSYEVFITRAGQFNSGISKIQCLYAPHIRANTEGGFIVIRNN